MKALSVKQPWAELIARGEKTVELRTWRTAYRGPLLICASQRPDAEYLEWFAAYLGTVPTGVSICTVELVDCRPVKRGDRKLSLYDAPRGFAWVLEKAKRVRKHPVKGKLSLFDVDI